MNVDTVKQTYNKVIENWEEQLCGYGLPPEILECDLHRETVIHCSGVALSFVLWVSKGENGSIRLHIGISPYSSKDDNDNYLNFLSYSFESLEEAINKFAILKANVNYIQLNNANTFNSDTWYQLGVKAKIFKD